MTRLLGHVLALAMLATMLTAPSAAATELWLVVTLDEHAPALPDDAVVFSALGFALVPGSTPKALRSTSAYPFQDLPLTTASFGAPTHNIERVGATTPPPAGLERIRVAVLDTGVDHTHPALRLAAANYQCVTPASMCVETQPVDTNGHGTHVAGIIGATGAGGHVQGVAPGVTIVSYQVITEPISNILSLYAALNHIIEHDTADVINLSLAAGFNAPPEMQLAFAAAADAGLIMVAASGNNGWNMMNVPADLPEVIAVTSMTDMNGRPDAWETSIHERERVCEDRHCEHDDTHSRFANTGPEVDIAAPGFGIPSLGTSEVNHETVYLSGTSMAAPHVAGAIARLLAEGIVHAGTPTSSEDARAALLAHHATHQDGPCGYDSPRPWAPPALLLSACESPAAAPPHPTPTGTPLLEVFGLAAGSTPLPTSDEDLLLHIMSIGGAHSTIRVLNESLHGSYVRPATEGPVVGFVYTGITGNSHTLSVETHGHWAMRAYPASAIPPATSRMQGSGPQVFTTPATYPVRLTVRPAVGSALGIRTLDQADGTLGQHIHHLATVTALDVPAAHVVQVFASGAWSIDVTEQPPEHDDPQRAPRFSDVAPHDLHAPSIAAVVNAGIATGYPDGTYRPTAPVTRAQMATFIARANGLEPAWISFPDVAPTDPHAPSIAAVAGAGIATGYPDGTYRPNAPVTRAQMATFIARAAGLA